MKKKIFCIIAVVLCLVSVLTMAVSASYAEDHYSFRYCYNKTHRWDIGEDRKVLIDPDTTYFPLLYDDSINNEDVYTREYYCTFYNKDLTNNDLPLLTTNDFKRIEISDTNPYHKNGYKCIAYETKWGQYFDDTNGYRMYDPFIDAEYDNVQLYIYIRNLESSVTYVQAEAVTQDIMRDPSSVTAHGIMFKSGIYEVQMRVVYNVTEATGNVLPAGEYNDSWTVNVSDMTEAEQNYYDEGYRDGYSLGYKRGLADLEASKQDWNVLTFVNAIMKAPFVFIDNAFGFEVFGINIAQGVRFLFTSALCILVFTLIIKRFI